MQRHELTAWLGPAAAELTPEQITRIGQVARDLAERFPDEGDRETALSTAVQYLLGDTTADEIGRRLLDARLAARAAYVAAEQYAVMLVDDGAPKAVAARAVGIDRMSLLKALGER